MFNETAEKPKRQPGSWTKWERGGTDGLGSRLDGTAQHWAQEGWTARSHPLSEEQALHTHTAFHFLLTPRVGSDSRPSGEPERGPTLVGQGALAMWPACDTVCMSHTAGQASALCSREREVRQMLPGQHPELP